MKLVIIFFLDCYLNCRLTLFSCLLNSDYCLHQLGMKDGRIEIGQITASSLQGSNVKPSGYHGAQHARLETVETPNNCGGWHAGKLDVNQWIQVNLRGVMWVSGVMIQGRNLNTNNQWVKRFKVLYRMYGANWATVQTMNKLDMVRNYSEYGRLCTEDVGDKMAL